MPDTRADSDDLDRIVLRILGDPTPLPLSNVDGTTSQNAGDEESSLPKSIALGLGEFAEDSQWHMRRDGIACGADWLAAPSRRRWTARTIGAAILLLMLALIVYHELFAWSTWANAELDRAVAMAQANPYESLRTLQNIVTSHKTNRRTGARDMEVRGTVDLKIGEIQKAIAAQEARIREEKEREEKRQEARRLTRAKCNRKYTELIARIHAPEDERSYGTFYEHGTAWSNVYKGVVVDEGPVQLLHGKS